MTELIDNIVYALFIDNFEKYDNEESKKDYQEFKKDAMLPHCGDCTWDSMPCIRCTYERLFKSAEIIMRVLYNEGYTQGGKIFKNKRK